MPDFSRKNSSYNYAHGCDPLWYTVQDRTVLIILPLIFRIFVTAPMMTVGGNEAAQKHNLAGGDENRFIDRRDRRDADEALTGRKHRWHQPLLIAANPHLAPTCDVSSDFRAG